MNEYNQSPTSFNYENSNQNSEIHSSDQTFTIEDWLPETPIFKFLQTFKLQQYAKQFREFGFTNDVCKLGMLMPWERHELLNKLHLMPGHWAWFVSLFEIIGKKVDPKITFIQKRKFKTSSSVSMQDESQKLFEKILTAEQKQRLGEFRWKEPKFWNSMKVLMSNRRRTSSKFRIILVKLSLDE